MTWNREYLIKNQNVIFSGKRVRSMRTAVCRFQSEALAQNRRFSKSVTCFLLAYDMAELILLLELQLCPFEWLGVFEKHNSRRLIRTPWDQAFPVLLSIAFIDRSRQEACVFNGICKYISTSRTWCEIFLPIRTVP